MRNDKEEIFSEYCYRLPTELIAKIPIEPRDSAKLLSFDTKTSRINHSIFRNLANFLPENSLLVFNDTKVVPARVWTKKETGGKVELLFLLNEWIGSGPLPAIADRQLAIGQKIFLSPNVALTIIGQKENKFFFGWDKGEESFLQILNEVGETPIPHYLEENTLSEDKLRKRYQSVWARKPASIAAPTASLHFTEKVLSSLVEKNIETVFVTLHVGLGTFARVSLKNLETRKLHQESYFIDNESRRKIYQARLAGRPIIAVGTTATRVLETLAEDILSGENGDLSGMTEIFIYPPYQFKIVDGLITNFHLPQTSLMALVDSFLQFKRSKKTIQEIYSLAIEKKYRFYSFGDGMFVF